MGNSQSDAREKKAHAVMNCIPGVNFAYNGVRAAVYAGKKNEKEVERSALGMLGGGIACIPLAGPAAFAAVPPIAGGVIASLPIDD